uniref:WS_DGAT_C domain-containing protein n=1 Tax=Globodera pallida TaxID=36090 RepID=A0A183CTX3_GLOPA
PPPPPTYVPPDHHVQQAGKAAAPMPTIYTAPTRGKTCSNSQRAITLSTITPFSMCTGRGLVWKISGPGADAYAQLVAMPHMSKLYMHISIATKALRQLHNHYPPPHVMLPTAAAVPMPATTAAVVGGGFPTAGTSMASGH